MALQTPHTFTRAEVASHTKGDSIYIIVDAKVYDITDFVPAHPGGEHVLLKLAGKDCTEEFYGLHKHEVLQKYHKNLFVGVIEGESPKVLERKPGELCPVPYAEPSWLNPRWASSPYFNDSHRRFQKEVRKLVDEHIRPEAIERGDAGERFSTEMSQKLADLNIYAMSMGPGKHLEGLTLLNGAIQPMEYTHMHEMILGQEFARSTNGAFVDGMISGQIIGLPPILNFSKNPALRNKISSEVFSGKKRICLAISEAFAGSDVAGIQTTATKSACGKFYIVNGTKKWITAGHWADYFTVACRTGKGISVLLIAREYGGVETKPLPLSYSSSAGTAYVTFDNVKVPAENLLGTEGDGFRVIMWNFNHERWVMISVAVSRCRLVVEECLKWTNQRKVFGKKLTSQGVIRQKLAKMIALVEASQAWLESITYQMCNMTYAQQASELAGQIALLKNFVTRCAHEVADESVQVFGGRGLTKSGMGRVIEMFNRTYKFDAVLGGSEEILADLAVRQAMKNMPKSML